MLVKCLVLSNVSICLVSQNTHDVLMTDFTRKRKNNNYVNLLSV